MKIKIGTRKSKLALAQTEMFIAKLKSICNDIEIETVHISTKGDKVLDKSLASIGGKGVFISELESALLFGEIDLAVHSAKDLPLELAEGLEISAVLERGNYRDVLVTKNNSPIKNISDFVVGTGSIRRRSFLHRLYPLVTVKDIRGNVDTRLRKLMNGEYDALILAAAGLERLGIYNSKEYTVTPFDYNEFLPSPCQGIIAVESRKNDERLKSYINLVNHQKTFYSFQLERAVPQILNADCGMPLGAYSEINDDKITLYVSGEDCKILSKSADISESFELAKELTKKL